MSASVLTVFGFVTIQNFLIFTFILLFLDDYYNRIIREYTLYVKDEFGENKGH